MLDGEQRDGGGDECRVKDGARWVQGDAEMPEPPMTSGVFQPPLAQFGVFFSHQC